VKKTFIGIFASLMLAGAISAVSGAAANTATETIVMIGEGSAPLPQVAATPSQLNDGTPRGR
jgi:hypothetical protein